MNTRLLLVSTLALPLLLLTSGCDNASSKDLAALQGTWTGTLKGGEEICTVAISGKEIRFDGPETDAWYKGTIALQPGSSPKRLLATVASSSVEKHVGKSAGFLYQIENGTLTIASLAPGSAAYPTGFNDSNARHFVLKK